MNSDALQAFLRLLNQFFVQSGTGWAVFGAMAAVMFGGIGSAEGIRTAMGQAAGVLSAKPDLFGKMFVLMALPGTQGFYGFIIAIMIASNSGIMAETVTIGPVVGLALFAIGACAGVVQWRSAVMQGDASAAAINLVGRRPEQSGRAIILPGLVETYAVVALLAAILMITWVAGPKAYKPNEYKQVNPAGFMVTFEDAQAAPAK
ncbi:MAG TPA: V-type ATP synthase subunit K [Candidatus Brocadiia bacterium]|nr:V-type ATP synthase subunit K [Candidatus Brocadiia bacterium]